MKVTIKHALATTADGRKKMPFNALRHGALSAYTILPWEDKEEYGALLDALVADHAPQGATEEHLVEEIAGIIWRKRRLRLGEAAHHRKGLRNVLRFSEDTQKAAIAYLADGEEKDPAGNAVVTVAQDRPEAIPGEICTQIREQVFGETLEPHNMDSLSRHEVHLDRKLERMLAMLIKLKQLRAVILQSPIPSYLPPRSVGD